MRSRMRAFSASPSVAPSPLCSRKIPVSPHCPHILQRRLQRFVTRNCTNVGIGTPAVSGLARCSITPRRPFPIRLRCRRANPVSAIPRRKLKNALSRVQVDHAVDLPATHRAERNVVPRKHDAVFLRAVIAVRFVQATLERADLARVLIGAEKAGLLDLLRRKEHVHLLLGPVLGAELAPALLEGLR